MVVELGVIVAFQPFTRFFFVLLLITGGSIVESMMSRASKSSIKIIPQGMLGVSEPPPEWFGNPDNEDKNVNWTNKNWLKVRDLDTVYLYACPT